MHTIVVFYPSGAYSLRYCVGTENWQHSKVQDGSPVLPQSLVLGKGPWDWMILL